MKKTLTIVLLVLVMVLCSFAGCADNEDYSLSLGTYVIEGEGLPLEFELCEGKVFTFYNLLLSSWPTEGSYTIRDKQLKLQAGDNIYCFNIDKSLITFDEEASEIGERDTALEALENGTSFTKAGPDRCRLDHNLGDKYKEES